MSRKRTSQDWLLARDKNEWVQMCKTFVVTITEVTSPKDMSKQDMSKFVAEMLKRLIGSYLDLVELGEDMPIYKPKEKRDVKELRETFILLQNMLEKLHEGQTD